MYTYLHLVESHINCLGFLSPFGFFYIFSRGSLSTLHVRGGWTGIPTLAAGIPITIFIIQSTCNVQAGSEKPIVAYMEL